VPATRVTFFVHQDGIPILTDDGWILFERAVDFATSPLPVHPEGSLPSTWGAIKAERQ
jgi:hypothetical protein